MTNDKLPEETQEQVCNESAQYLKKLIADKRDPCCYAVTDYIAGATAWAPWKVRFDELQATIDDKIDKALHAERNKMQAMVTKMDMDCLQRAQGLADALEWIRVYGNVGELTIKFIDKALQQFKDGKDQPKVDLGKCRQCGRPATKDYNDHEYNACDSCYDRLSNEFDSEYR